MEEAGAGYDSTIGYNETVGYRSGATQVYKPLMASDSRTSIACDGHPLFYPDTWTFPRQAQKFSTN